MSTIIGTQGRDTITGTSADDVLIGKGGRDVIRGGDGNDIIIGFDIGGNTNSKREIDVLFGGTGSDVFVIANGYTGNGDQNYALIEDFSTLEGDRILLTKGVTYTYRQTPRGTFVYNNDDLVAHLRGTFLGTGIITDQSWTLMV